MRVSQLLPAEAKAIATWVYPAEHSIYKRSRESFHPMAFCFGVHDRNEELVGYATIGSAAYGSDIEPDHHALDIAFAMRPSRMRQGNGHEFVSTVMSFADAHAAYIGTPKLRAVVEDWNLVALNIARALGFEVSSTKATRLVLTKPVGRAALEIAGAGHYLG